MSKAKKLKTLGCTKQYPLLKDQKFKNTKSIRLLIKEKDSGCIKVINVESLLIFEKNIISPIDFFKSGLAFLNNGFLHFDLIRFI